MKFFYTYLCLITILFSCSNSQTDTFNKIEYASFDVNSNRTETRDSAYINMYFTLSNNGLIEINNKDDYHKTHTYYSFQLTDDEKKKLASVFNQTRNLKSYLTDTTMEDNSFYAGSYDFYRVTYSNGTVDSVCIIPPYMNKEFDNVYNFLHSMLYIREDKKEIKQFDVPDFFRNTLKSCYLKSTYLPEIKNPPSFRLEDEGK